MENPHDASGGFGTERTVVAGGEVSLQLKYPIEFQQGGRTVRITEVSIRRMRVKDSRAIGKLTNDADIGHELICRLCSLPDHAVNEMDVEDSAAIGAIISGFTTPGRPIGSDA